MSILTQLKLRDFRCFDALECEFSPGMNVIVGPNAQGKTSLLEAACVLLRLQSPRIATLARAIRHEQKGFVLDGYFGERHLQFYFGKQRKKLALDSVEQKSAHEYLGTARAVWFSNQDIELVRGAADKRRKFLDFVAAQTDAGYRRQLRTYEKALRSRNHLLKAPRPDWREISSFNQPLVDAGNYVAAARAALVANLQPFAGEAQQAISGLAETLSLEYVRGAREDFASALEAARSEDLRLRQTGPGPHRDDVVFSLNAVGTEFASEGQQRSVVLALKLAQARLIERQADCAPVLLLDDIFGELDVRRRTALLEHLPSRSQKLITTTHIDWLGRMPEGALFSMSAGMIQRQ
jgi:DNA replication and repair protein RecF